MQRTTARIEAELEISNNKHIACLENHNPFSKYSFLRYRRGYWSKMEHAACKSFPFEFLFNLYPNVAKIFGNTIRTRAFSKQNSISRPEASVPMLIRSATNHNVVINCRRNNLSILELDFSILFLHNHLRISNIHLTRFVSYSNNSSLSSHTYVINNPVQILFIYFLLNQSI